MILYWNRTLFLGIIVGVVPVVFSLWLGISWLSSKIGVVAWIVAAQTATATEELYYYMRKNDQKTHEGILAFIDGFYKRINRKDFICELSGHKSKKSKSFEVVHPGMASHSVLYQIPFLCRPF